MIHCRLGSTCACTQPSRAAILYPYPYPGPVFRLRIRAPSSDPVYMEPASPSVPLAFSFTGPLYLRLFHVRFHLPSLQIASSTPPTIPPFVGVVAAPGSSCRAQNGLSRHPACIARSTPPTIPPFVGVVAAPGSSCPVQKCLQQLVADGQGYAGEAGEPVGSA